ncbi:MAG: class I SAM-dependent methyltransferase [Gemmatimonadetes bacterium]|nr:class I SAM-dependent methyltransferase [Gemmatimonadota bacterium]
MPESPSALPAAASAAHAAEVARGERFEFGKNWASFLRVLDDERIASAQASLVRMLGLADLAGKRFLDAGSGSGLSSLVARRLGADVVSFDYDPSSVGCTAELRRRYYFDDPRWRVEAGSVLDPAYLQGLGAFDVVYSWGVIHHTGAMWDGLDLIARNVKPGGRLFIAIYNDQGAWSRRWHRIKALYNSGVLGRWLVKGTVIPYWAIRQAAADIVHLRNPVATWTDYSRRRGMSLMHDWIDWIGGYPFEVAMPEEILDFYSARGFRLVKLKTSRGTVGCNEFVFVHES